MTSKVDALDSESARINSTVRSGNHQDMEQEESICDWPSDDGSHPPGPDLSSSEDEESQIAILAPRSQLRPAGSALAFVPYANWDPERSYDGEPTIRRNMEWKIFLKNREQAGESELDIVIAPRKFWKHVLQPKIAEESVNKPWKRKNTKLILSVADCRTAKIQKRYTQDVDWSFVATQLREVSRFLKDEKKITIAVTFYYEMTDADTGKSGRGGATANQLDELEVRTTGRGRGPSFYQEACRLMECGGKSCAKGSDHCWDHQGKHFPLLPHHIRILAEHQRTGKPLQGHDDVPEDFRRLVQDDDRQRQEREQKEKDRMRKRRRRDSDRSSHGMRLIPCPCAPGHGDISKSPSTPRIVFPTSPAVELGIPRNEAVRAYNEWQRAQVSDDEQRQPFDKALELTLAHGFSLSVIAVNQHRMYSFYKEHGVMDGIAWHYVCDVKAFVQLQQQVGDAI